MTQTVGDSPPGDWTHTSGYRLGWDGARIEYAHPSGLTASVEAMVDPDENEDRLQLRPAVLAPDKQFLEYPPIVYETEEALATLYEWMRDYPGAGGGSV